MDSGGFAIDAADKELADVDPEMGCVLVSWINFKANGVEMRGLSIVKLIDRGAGSEVSP